MIRQTIEEIEARLKAAPAVKDETRSELLALLDTLRSEINQLEQTDQDQARSIANFTGLSTHEATRQRVKPELLEVSLNGLSSSVTGFEKSHPRLVEVVNSICTTLSNLGI